MITTQYVFNDQLIAQGCSPPAPLPTFLKVPTRHTLDDLLKVKLEPSRHPITLDFDTTYIPPRIDWDAKIQAAYLSYHKSASSRGGVADPRFETWQNRLRWRLYRLLQRVGVTF